MNKQTLQGSLSALSEINACVQHCDQLFHSGQHLQLELELRAARKKWPGAPEFCLMLADLAQGREDWRAASQWLLQASLIRPSDLELAFKSASFALDADDVGGAISQLCKVLRHTPTFALGWLLLGDALVQSSRPFDALRARYQAVTRAQADGMWTDIATTPTELVPAVKSAIDAVRRGRSDHIRSAYEGLRQQHGSFELQRVDLAVQGYLGEVELVPESPHQRPKFFYFPGLQSGPYHNPYLQPWAKQLEDRFEAIREEALKVWSEGVALQDFMGLKAGQDSSKYVGGIRSGAAWDAYFFYRHGRRFDQNHLACPLTSSTLDLLDLCRIRNQTPEICFSVLRAGTHIKLHHGVTNTRLVMHLPLRVPGGCYLNVLGGGKHHWKEGRLMMFDDTFEHEAWNPSDTDRLIVLMDCWNPLLSSIERLAVHTIVEAIDDLERFEPHELDAIKLSVGT